MAVKTCVHLENSDKLEETLINDDKTLIKAVESDPVKKEDNVNLKNTDNGELIASVETSDVNAFVKKTQNSYTEQEVKDAKQIIRIFGEGTEIFAVRTESGNCALKWATLSEGFGLKISQFYIGIEDGLFPSIHPGECAKIKDIANYICNNSEQYGASDSMKMTLEKPHSLPVKPQRKR